jgi:hypothetical protein
MSNRESGAEPSDLESGPQMRSACARGPGGRKAYSGEGRARRELASGKLKGPAGALAPAGPTDSNLYFRVPGGCGGCGASQVLP